MPIKYVASPGGSGAGGAPTDATYVTLSTNATLSNERVLTQGSGITITDAGAGSTVTIATNSASAQEASVRHLIVGAMGA